MDREQSPLEKTSHRTVLCRSCGAEYPADSASCPYCGTMNLPAAETEYLDRLEGIRDNLEELGSLTDRKAKSHLRKLQRNLLIGAVILATNTSGSARHFRDLTKRMRPGITICLRRCMPRLPRQGTVCIPISTLDSAMRSWNLRQRPRRSRNMKLTATRIGSHGSFGMKYRFLRLKAGRISVWRSWTC